MASIRWPAKTSSSIAVFDITCDHAGVDGPVAAAWAAAAVSLMAVVVGALVTSTSSQRQRTADLVAAALSQMGGGTQNRSAAVAALMVLRGPLKRRQGFHDRRAWRRFGPAVGQQLFRQLMYVLNHGHNRFESHAAETIIAMTDWLLRDELLAFKDPAQCHRLHISLRAYRLAASGKLEAQEASLPSNASIEALMSRLDGWLKDLARRYGERG